MLIASIWGADRRTPPPWSAGRGNGSFALSRYAAGTRLLRPIILIMLLAGAAWFAFGSPPSAHALWRGTRDLLDRRPGRRVLVLGNSRTYFHDMPDMIRDIADSAGDPRRYGITMDAQPGGSMETLWGDPAVQSLLH